MLLIARLINFNIIIIFIFIYFNTPGSKDPGG